MKNTQEIFEGKTFQDLTKDIYSNSCQKKQQIGQLIQEIHQYIKSIDEAILVAPVIKELMDVSKGFTLKDEEILSRGWQRQSLSDCEEFRG